MVSRYKIQQVDLVLPGLMNLPMHELNQVALEQATPQLHRLLRFAERITVEEKDFDTTLINLLGLKQRALPYARAFNQKNNGHALLIKPVHLKADINNAIVFPVEQDEQDIELIINDLSDFFKYDCDVNLVAQNLWLMQLHHTEPVKSAPHYLSAVGKKVTHYIEQGKTSLDWFKLFNEMQMFMYQHPVNQQRLQQGKLTINSLWCWGADDYQGEKIESLGWVCDDVDLRQLGGLYCEQVDQLPGLRYDSLNADTLVIVELSLLKALKSGLRIELEEVLKQLEQKCLAPLMDLQFKSLNIHTASNTNFNYKPYFAYKFWKKGSWSTHRG